jgi:hypothetical protein
VAAQLKRKPVRPIFVIGSVIRYVTALLLVLIAPMDGAAQVSGDTDGVVARGLLPLDGSPTPLVIRDETVAVTLYADVIRTERIYIIENIGAASDFVLGNLCGGPNRLDVDCGIVTVDGSAPPMTRHTGYLVDRDSIVRTQDKSRENIEACLANVDGGVCGHEWIAFPLHLNQDERATIKLTYDSEYTEPYWIETVARQLYLYSEKFFKASSIWSLPISIGVAGGDFDIEAWTPRGLYARHSTSPSRAEDGRIVWNFSGYSPAPHTGFHGLLHPWAIDEDAIREAAAAAASSPERPNKR